MCCTPTIHNANDAITSCKQCETRYVHRSDSHEPANEPFFMLNDLSITSRITSIQMSKVCVNAFWTTLKCVYFQQLFLKMGIRKKQIKLNTIGTCFIWICLHHISHQSLSLYLAHCTISRYMRYMFYSHLCAVLCAIYVIILLYLIFQKKNSMKSMRVQAFCLLASASACLFIKRRKCSPTSCVDACLYVCVCFPSLRKWRDRDDAPQ